MNRTSRLSKTSFLKSGLRSKRKSVAKEVIKRCRFKKPTRLRKFTKYAKTQGTSQAIRLHQGVPKNLESRLDSGRSRSLPLALEKQIYSVAYSSLDGSHSVTRMELPADAEGTLQVFGSTLPGLRSTNQDGFAAVRHQNGSVTLIGGDGLGGYYGGEKANHLAVQAAKEHAENKKDGFSSLPELIETFQASGEALRNHADPEANTTLLVLHVTPDGRAMGAWNGDTGVCLMRGLASGDPELLWTSHNVGTPEYVMNVQTDAFNFGKPTPVHTVVMEGLSPDDAFILYTDGLTLSRERMLELARHNSQLGALLESWTQASIDSMQPAQQFEGPFMEFKKRFPYDPFKSEWLMPDKSGPLPPGNYPLEEGMAYFKTFPGHFGKTRVQGDEISFSLEQGLAPLVIDRFGIMNDLTGKLLGVSHPDNITLAAVQLGPHAQGGKLYWSEGKDSISVDKIPVRKPAAPAPIAARAAPAPFPHEASIRGILENLENRMEFLEKQAAQSGIMATDLGGIDEVFVAIQSIGSQQGGLSPASEKKLDLLTERYRALQEHAKTKNESA